MANELALRRVAILATDGVEQVELERPREAVEQAGAHVSLLSPHGGDIQAMNGDIDKGATFHVDAMIANVSADEFDALILPGGTINPDRLRLDPHAVSFVRNFVESGKPVGAICHGPWMLVEADVVAGRTMTAFPSIRTDIRNAGGIVVDQEAVSDRGLVTSRHPDDLPVFCSKIVQEFAESTHAMH